MVKKKPEKQEMPPKHPEAESKGLICGACQWFSAGFNGNSCQKTRLVEFDTMACREFTLPLDDPFHEIVIKDKYIHGIREDLRRPRFNIDESISEEMRGYVIDTDLTKYSFGSVQDMEAISDTLKKIIQYRSRLSSIYTTLIDVKYDFEARQQHYNLWLNSKYACIRELRNDTMRKAAMARILPEIIDISRSLEMNLALAKHAEEHLENNERTLSKILGSSEKLWFSKEDRWKKTH